MEITAGDWFSEPQNWVFLVFALLMVGSAIQVVTNRNVVHAVLFLVVTLIGSAALFLLLGAEFVAWTVVLISIGAVVVLFLFGIMITRAPMGRDVGLDHARRWPAALIALALFTLMSASMTSLFENQALGERVVRTGDLGESIFERFVIPFEVVSVLLLAALIGSIVLARRDPSEEEQP
ncbi:MAG: NADH-quinone oxidoreductase subunit J [Acidimicrobiia bacterium]|nr:NADH-quinone oxidoreductase subunit J [Acidimicrobiia bacterium]MDH3469930.1 NADH-quinone oxidoreductase subunit J [Acidimicrobiia bacterium]